MQPLDIKTGTRSRTRRNRLWIIPQAILPVLVLAGAVMVMQHMIRTKPEVMQRKPRERVYVVESAAVKIADRRPSFTVYGNVVAANSVDLRALVAGEVLKVHPSLGVGSFVEKGSALVEIDPFAYKGAVTEAVANLAEAKAKLTESNARKAQEESALDRAMEQLAIAEKDLERAQSLVRKGAMTERSIDDRRLVVSQRRAAVEQRRDNLKIESARLEQYRTAIERLEWKLSQARRNLENTVLKAPFDGIVTSENVEPGRLLNANDMAVALYDWKSLEAKFTLSDQQFGRITRDGEGLVGRQVKVAWNIGDKPVEYSARIERAGAQIASQRGGVEIYARIDVTSASVRIRPGAFVKVTVPDRLIARTARLPETAVYSDDHVFVIDKGRLARRDVEVLAYAEGDVLVRGALKDGEQVLTTRIAEAGSGLAVRTGGEGGGKKPAGDGTPGAPGPEARGGHAPEGGATGRGKRPGGGQRPSLRPSKGTADAKRGA